MATTQSITPSNSITWGEVEKVAKQAAEMRKSNDNGGLTSLQEMYFPQIINDPSRSAMEKFRMLMKITGGTFTPTENLMISNLFQDFTQTMTMLTNMVKLVHETMMSAVRNIRA